MSGTKGVEAHGITEYYRKTGDELGVHEQRTGSLELNAQGDRHVNDGDEIVDDAVVEQGLEALEEKKKAWYAYFLTTDFWIVLLIGYGF